MSKGRLIFISIGADFGRYNIIGIISIFFQERRDAMKQEQREQFVRRRREYMKRSTKDLILRRISAIEEELYSPTPANHERPTNQST